MLILLLPLLVYLALVSLPFHHTSPLHLASKLDLISTNPDIFRAPDII
jgi:hypothetical protein